jgi:hypothetical protein
LATLLSHESRLMESADRKQRSISGRKREAVTGGSREMFKTNSIICMHKSGVQIKRHETGGISRTDGKDENCIQNFDRTL